MEENKKDFKSILNNSAKKALGGGVAGASAMGCQVLSLMWLRTTMNYQYRYGTTTKTAIKSLYKDGGVKRFYRGVSPALLQGPLSRFGDTAANTGVLELLNSYEKTKDLPLSAKTLCASFMAALWRVNLMPIDTLKTSLQVNGKEGLSMLAKKTRNNGAGVFYHGTVATFSATYVGHFPWFYTYNYLDNSIPKQDTMIKNLTRNAVIGFTSSVISDSISNSIRVLKTTRQTYDRPISYLEAGKEIIKNDGIKGLLGRGLKTRIIANGLQGMMFTVLWKAFMSK
ncbi:MAG: hypothetical protein KAJ19_24480 [Gammaproteobacteria bacterium]|nr:hypothetical protein [Gammaproteobacteria bacterium]